MKYGVTLRTMQRRFHGTMRAAPDSIHNVVLSKGQTREAALRAFNQVAYSLRATLGRIATTTHSRGRDVISLEWLVQEGEPGDDILIFLDEYEDE
jgi:hypothetical protein